jgi:hypothetical protein
MDEFEDLLNLPRPKQQASEIAILGGHEDDLTIAGGYLQVAEIAARHWINHGSDDGLPIPILFNYRHGIELTLKWLIRLTARCLVRDGYTREDLNPAKLDEKLDRHNIKKLADRLDRYMGLLQIDAPDNRIDNASRRLLDWLDSEDQPSLPVCHGRPRAWQNGSPTEPGELQLLRAGQRTTQARQPRQPGTVIPRCDCARSVLAASTAVARDR